MRTLYKKKFYFKLNELPFATFVEMLFDCLSNYCTWMHGRDGDESSNSTKKLILLTFYIKKLYIIFCFCFCYFNCLASHAHHSTWLYFNANEPISCLTAQVEGQTTPQRCQCVKGKFSLFFFFCFNFNQKSFANNWQCILLAAV